MRAPYVFESRDHLIQALKAQSTREAAERFFASRTDTVACAVKEGVCGNTFRAFRNVPLKPSAIFREWATRHLHLTLEDLLAINTPAHYSQYVHSATLALNQHWLASMQSEMGYGRGSKLLNLALKKLGCLSAATDTQRAALISLMHVPLDRYTIVGLLAAAPELGIRRSATMGHITSAQQYQAFQTFIGTAAREAGVPAIYYDIVAWDRAHRPNDLALSSHTSRT